LIYHKIKNWFYGKSKTDFSTLLFDFQYIIEYFKEYCTMYFLMKLKTLKIWLFLLPIVGILGIVLYVQSNKNQEELEAQYIRSISAIEEDIKRALPDFYARVEAFFIRKGYAEFAKDSSMKSQSIKIASRINFKLDYQNAQIIPKSQTREGNLALKNGKLFKKNLQINLSDEEFKNWEIRSANSLQINPIEVNQNSALLIDLNIDIGDLLRKQENNKIFERFVITDDEGLGIYPDPFKGLQVFNPKKSRFDSLGNTISGVSVEELIFSNELNRSYISPLPLENLDLYVIGMIQETNFQKVGLRINFDLISALLLFLFLLIASIPLLGIINLSKGDNLTQNKVIQSGISLMGLFLVIGFTVSTYKNKPEPIDEETYDLAEMIRRTVFDSLETKERILNLWNQDANHSPARTTYNELISFNQAGFADLLKYDDGKKGKGLINYLGKKSAIDLSDRKYFKFFLPENKPSETYIQSHHSRGSGKLETVISKDFSDSTSEIPKIRAITFDLHVLDTFKSDSLNENDIAKTHRFLIFKKSGDVIYSSVKISSPISNIQEGLSAEKWKEIATLIQNNENDSIRKFEVPIYLNGNQYIALLQKVSKTRKDNLNFDEPIWLMFLVNQNITNIFTSLASFEAVIFMGIYFLFLLFSLGIKLVTRKSTDEFGFKTFLYEGLKPVGDHLNRLQFLSVIYLLIFVALMSLYTFASINHLEFLCVVIFVSTLVSLINLSTQIDASKWKSPNNLSLTFYSTVGVAMLEFFVMNEIFSYSLASYFLGAILGAFIFSLYWFLRQQKKNLIFKKISAENVLTCYLTCWFLVIGFLPGYMIHSKTFDFEKRIWEKREFQVENEEKRAIDKGAFSKYESARRSLMFTLSDPFDQRIVDFITPDHDLLRGHLSGQGEELIWEYFVSIITFLVILALLIHWIQTKIFFELKGDWLSRKKIDLNRDLLFLCSTNSKNIDEVIDDKLKKEGIYPEQLLEFDMLQGIGDLSNLEIDPAVNYIHLKNFHCLKEPLEIIKIIYFLQVECEFNVKIIVSSGKSWKDTANTIKNVTDKMRFSEFFSDFHFILLPLRASSKAAFAERDIISPKDYNDLMQKQRSRKAYLYNLWTELNFDEKMACYSFAQEGFFNIARKDTLIELAQKGIIVPVKNFTKVKVDWDDWELFSAVFRKYILDSSTDEEIKSFQSFEKANGNAATIQVSAVSFVLICFALIGIFDKNFFNEAYAYATGSLGILGTLYTLINRGLSSFKFGKTES